MENIGTIEKLLTGGQVCVGKDDHKHAEFFGNLSRDRENVIALLDRARRQHHLGCVPWSTVERVKQIRLLDLSRQPGAGSAPLNINDDERCLGHHGQALELGLQRHAWP